MRLRFNIFLCTGLLLIIASSIIGQKSENAILKDLDKDGISDFIEKLSSLDPSEDECRYNKFSNSCKDISVNGLLGREYFIYILDESGSMNLPMNQKTRMEVAKEIVIKYIKNLPSNFYSGFTDFPMRLGMYSYGKTASCDSIEELQSPYKLLKRKKLISLIEEMKPHGKTPIARSIDFVGEIIK